MKSIFIGKDEDGQPIRLGDRELETHVHGIGASRTGKSKLVEWITREMIRNRQGFCLIDPHGFSLRRHCALACVPSARPRDHSVRAGIR